MKKNKIQQIENIQNRIFNIRSKQIMLDSDLAELYNVETKVLNQAVKRNLKRFPHSFRFRLSNSEKNELVTNCDRLEKLKHSSSLPYAFTEQGVSMLSAVLKSDIAIEVSIKIIESFVSMRKLISSNYLFERFERIENKLTIYDKQFDKLFNALEKKTKNLQQGIFYDGQIFDAYVFVTDIIKSAKHKIILVDNYIDESVLTLLTKRHKKVNATIYSKNLSKAFLLDLQKHNSQYNNITVKSFNKTHDRFLIIDDTTVYHIGASIKDLGKKWFAFSKMEMSATEITQKLNKG